MRSSNGAAAFTHVLLPSEAWWGSPDHYIALYRVVTHSAGTAVPDRFHDSKHVRLAAHQPPRGLSGGSTGLKYIDPKGPSGESISFWLHVTAHTQSLAHAA